MFRGDEKLLRRGSRSPALLARPLILGALVVFSLTLGTPSRDPGGATPAEAVLPPSLEPFLPDYPEATMNALANLKGAVEKYLDGKYEAALDQIRSESSGRETRIGDVYLLYRAKSQLALNQTEQARKDFHSFRTRYPDSIHIQKAILGEAESWLKSKAPSEALEILRTAPLQNTPKILYFSARAYEESGRKQDAIERYLRVYAQYVNSDLAIKAFRRVRVLDQKKVHPATGFRVILERAENLLRAGKVADSRKLLVQLGRHVAPDREAAERYRLARGDAESRRRRSTASLTYLQKVSTADPKLHAPALSLKALAYSRLGRENLLLKVRDETLRLYPDSPFTEAVLDRVADYLAANNKLDQAKIAYEALIERFPRGDRALGAMWKMAFFSYHEKDYPLAAAWFWKQVSASANPESAAGAIFWMGRCYEKLGDWPKAISVYESASLLSNDHYYGQRAREAKRKLLERSSPRVNSHDGLDFREITLKLDALQLPLSPFAPPANEITGVIERARQLTLAQLHSLALEELEWALRQWPHQTALRYLVSRVYENRGDQHNAIVSIRRAFPHYVSQHHSTLPGEVRQVLFPNLYMDSILRHARKHKLDPSLVMAVIRQESAFNASARSRADARGLMQVLPSTARQIARRAGVRGFTNTKLYQPEDNIMLGTYYLSTRMRKFEDSEPLALAAYNAGASRAVRWMNEFGIDDMDEFVEQIPFNETRNYVKRVLSFKAHYSRLRND